MYEQGCPFSLTHLCAQCLPPGNYLLHLYSCISNYPQGKKGRDRDRDLSNSGEDSALDDSSLSLTCSLQVNPAGAEDSGLGARVDDM